MITVCKDCKNQYERYDTGAWHNQLCPKCDRDNRTILTWRYNWCVWLDKMFTKTTSNFNRKLLDRMLHQYIPQLNKHEFSMFKKERGYDY